MQRNEDRYSRQRVLAEIGDSGQQKLLEATVLIVGCGALGSIQGELLTRAGVGRIRIADRDLLELNNLQRQFLFDEEDVAARLPKAEAAARKLRKINSSVMLEPLVVDVTPQNVESLIGDAALVLDATDNFETRYLVNDACVKLGKPWIYGGVIGTTGMTMAVNLGSGPCFRCLFPDAPEPGSLPTCETLGVLNTVPTLIAALQATAALRILVGEPAEAQLQLIDAWKGSHRAISVKRTADCPCCNARQFDFLDSRRTAWTTTLCGRNAVQISPAQSGSVAIDELGRKLAPLGKVTQNALLLQFEIGEYELIVFPDGRAIVKGTTDPAVARSLVAKYLGS